MSLSYQDCLELKETGFPQELKKGTLMAGIDNITPTHLLVPGGTYNLPQDDLVYIPTLEELIEACPKEHYLNLQQCKNKWRASIAKDNNEIYEAVCGSSPSQAVKNLWIELQK